MNNLQERLDGVVKALKSPDELEFVEKELNAILNIVKDEINLRSKLKYALKGNMYSTINFLHAYKVSDKRLRDRINDKEITIQEVTDIFIEAFKESLKNRGS